METQEKKVSLWTLFWVMAKIGVMTFGGGYAMNEDELRFETELFREAFLRSGKPKIQENAQPDVSQNISANSSGSISPNFSGCISPNFSGSISPDLLLREAEEALLRLRRHAVTSPAGDISWLAADPDSSLRPMDCGLMNGFMGVGIFASAMLAAENETGNAASETKKEARHAFPDPERL